MTLPFWPFRKPKSKLELLQDSVQNVLSGTSSGVHDTLDRLPLDRVSVPLSAVKEGAADTLGHASSTVASALSSTATRAAEVVGSVAGGAVAKASMASHVLADAGQTLVEKAGAGLHGAAETASGVAHGAAETASNVAQGTAKTASGAALSVAQTAGTVSGSAADTIQAKVQNMHQTAQERAAQLAEQARDTAEAARKATRKSAKSAGQAAASGGEATVEAAQATRDHAAELIAAAVAALSEATAQASKKARQRAEEARHAATEAAADAAQSARDNARQGAKIARLKTEAKADAAANAEATAKANAEEKDSQSRGKFPVRLSHRREKQFDAQHEEAQRAEMLHAETLRAEAEREAKQREAAQAARETNKKLKKEKRRAEKKSREIVVERDVARSAPEAVRYAPQVQVEDATSKWLWIALGALAGASLMLFLAPSNGRRSRALVKDKLKSAGGNAAKLRHDAARRAADLRNRAEGKLHEASSGSDEDFADDNTIADRVRTALGENELTRNLERLNVDCVDGIVTLRGPMMDEALKTQIESIVREVKGVREVHAQFLIEDSSEDVFVG